MLIPHEAVTVVGDSIAEKDMLDPVQHERPHAVGIRLARTQIGECDRDASQYQDLAVVYDLVREDTDVRIIIPKITLGDRGLGQVFPVGKFQASLGGESR